MPPRWSRVPTRKDPDFRRLDDRMTFATHVAAFFRLMQKADWSWTPWMTGGWALGLLAHGLYVFVIANYAPTDSTPAD
jgi:hypothetical protein